MSAARRGTRPRGLWPDGMKRSDAPEQRRDGAHLAALGGARRAQDRGHRRAARHVIDVHRRKITLVVMRVPERKLLCRRCRVPPACPASRSCRADQAEPQTAAPPRSCSAHSPDERWSIATPLRTAANRDLQQRIMPQPVEVDGVLVAARNRRRARHHHLEHRVPHRLRKPPAHPELALRLSQQQQTAIRGLIAAVKRVGRICD